MKRNREIPFLKTDLMKKALSVAAIAIFGFILLNLAFVLDALFQGAINLLARLLVRGNFGSEMYWFPPFRHFLFAVLVCAISFFVFKSRLGDLAKAVFMTVPLATVFATIGIFLNRWQVPLYAAGILFSFGVLYYLRKTNRPWQYYCSLILVSLAMLLVMLTGTDI